MSTKPNNRFVVEFKRVPHAELHHILQPMIFNEVVLSDIRHFQLGAYPNAPMDSTVNVSAGSNPPDLKTLVDNLHKLPVCIFSLMESITINK